MRNNRGRNIEPFQRLSVKVDNLTAGADKRFIQAQGKSDSSSGPPVQAINYTHRHDNKAILILSPPALTH